MTWLNGQEVYVTTTAAGGCLLGAGLATATTAEAFKGGYGEFKTEARELDFIRRSNSGWIEGLNNKIKLLKRRCYGITKPTSLLRRLWLDLNGYQTLIG